MKTKWPKTKWLHQVAARTLDLTFPPVCLSCDIVLELPHDQIGFCTECRSQLSPPDDPSCRRCASRVPKIPGEVDNCPRCSEQRLYFDRAISMGDYQGFRRNLLLEMKVDRSQRLAHAMGLWMAKTLGDQIRALRPDAIAPIPMHLWRRLARGTNAPASLAESLSKKIQVPCFPKLLYRRRNTQPQLGLSHAARFQNVYNQMCVKTGFCLESPHVLLVDDILTTGATCSEAAKVLKRAGASQVTVLVAARTPRE